MSIETTVMTTAEVANRFKELASQEKWFEIQDELFSEDVKSIEPPHATYLKNAEGKVAVRQKGENLVSKIESAEGSYTSEPIVSAHHFAVYRKLEITIKDHGKVRIDQIMLYEVRNGEIVSEQFFY